ncbi:uncharacterized protein [Bos taurus]|uniref:uncharacterized protein isoform X2 n=1 Tax=Bos taurus TaxID=9913 RepID=UPI0028CB62DB|nr:uncharacterized protein LOC112441475 isoform X2 [Bos taurus]
MPWRSPQDEKLMSQQRTEIVNSQGGRRPPGGRSMTFVQEAGLPTSAGVDPRALLNKHLKLYLRVFSKNPSCDTWLWLALEDIPREVLADVGFPPPGGLTSPEGIPACPCLLTGWAALPTSLRLQTPAPSTQRHSKCVEGGCPLDSWELTTSMRCSADKGKGPLARTAWIWAERFFLTRSSGLQQNSMCLLLKCNRARCSGLVSSVKQGCKDPLPRRRLSLETAKSDQKALSLPGSVASAVMRPGHQMAPQRPLLSQGRGGWEDPGEDMELDSHLGKLWE